MEAELGASQAYASTLSMKLSASEAAKEKAKSEKEAVVAEKLRSKEHSDSRYQKLRKKYNHYKNKSKRLLGQLAFVLKLRDFSWGRGYNWGFENYRTLELNSEIYTYDKAIVSPFFVRIPEKAIKEVEELGKSFLPDVPDWSDNAPNLWRSLMIPEPLASEPAAEEDRETASEDLSFNL